MHLKYNPWILAIALGMAAIILRVTYVYTAQHQ